MTSDRQPLRIGHYQLENLLNEGVRFLFIDFRTPAEKEKREAEPLFAKAMPMSPVELNENLRVNQIPPDAAIVLLDETGDISARVALELEDKGFKNVYVFRGGAAATF